MIILAGTIRVAVGQRDSLLDALTAVVESTRAESGCLAYSFAFDVLDPHLINVFEVFEDEAALATHRASLHMAEWRAALPLLGIDDRNMWHYDVSSARQI
jgi:quinol monooxygenase YgiN